MSFLGDAAKAVMEELGITKPEKGEFDGVIFPGDFFEDVPGLEGFLSPEPDVIGEDGHPRISAAHDGEMEVSSLFILGGYRRMQSPGVIVLFRRNLGLFYKALLREIVRQFRYMSKYDLEAGAQFVASHTYYHEQFHFACDVMHHLFGSKLDVFMEEALAVAWARLRITEERNQWNTPTGRMSGVFFSLLMDHSFNYRSAGYSDWSLYSDEIIFRKALTDYVLPANLHQLIANGVALDEITYALVKSIKGKVVEKIQ
jgi:hypothetical protein